MEEKIYKPKVVPIKSPILRWLYGFLVKISTKDEKCLHCKVKYTFLLKS